MPQSFVRLINTDTVQTKKGKSLAPKLRFREFKTDWSMKCLKEVLTLVLRPIEMDDNKPYSLVTVKRRYEGIIQRGIFLGKDVLVKSQFLLKKNDFLISKRQISHNSCGVVPEALDGSIVSNEYSVFVPTKGNDVFFFSYFCNRPQLSKTFFLSSIGVHIEKMLFKVDDWLKWKFHFPSLPEQQKIASFLSAVDEKIQQLTRKKELLEQYKKGVMQQLFSGKLRFKDENGKAYSKWEGKLFENIYSFYSTNSLSRDKLNYESGSVKNIHYGDIHTKFRSQFVLNEEYVPYINGDVDLSKVKRDNYCKEGDLVIADASEDYNDIGKAIELVKLNNEKVVAGLHTFLARPDLSKIKIGFSGYMVQAPYVRMQVKKIAQGSKVLSLSPSRLGKIKLLIPGKEEQQKIAIFLSSIDSKIESVSIQIEQTKNFKKGLLQQMFV